MPTRRFATLTCLGGLALAPAVQAKIIFDFDYSFEPVNGFFAQNPQAKTALQQASTVYSDRLLDKLPAIAPTGSDSWYGAFTNPSTGAAGAQTPTNLAIPADTLKVYIGAYNLGGALGLGGPGGYNVSGSNAIMQAVQYRGQPGAAASTPTDFGSWGGSISFDNSAAAKWSFNLAAPAAGKNDFLTVATHELAHVLGFGTAGSLASGRPGSWINLTTPSGFTGPKATTLYGGAVPLDPNRQHFNNGVMSTVGGAAQETLMDPDITVGTRKYASLLDWAALDDIGWDLARLGDANADGAVNFSDLALLAQNYNHASDLRWARGDFNYDGLVNFSDLALLAQNYNTTGPQAADAVPASASPAFAADWAAALATVPEPSTATLLALTALSTLLTRRRRG